MTTIKKNNLFGRRNRYFHLFLQNLKLKKNKNLFNRNLIKNYYFYNFFIKSLKKNKVNFLLRSLFLLNNQKFLINPVFLFKKKVFNNQYQYNEFIKINNLKSLFFGKKYISKKLFYNFFENSFGLNYFLLENSNKKNNFVDSLNSEEFKDVVKLKFSKTDLKLYDYNIFNYNVFVFNLLEIYKIIILLNVFYKN